jgi:apolipoprotein N-acyltransferase
MICKKYLFVLLTVGILCFYLSFPNPIISFPLLAFVSLVPLFISVHGGRLHQVIVYSFFYIFATCLLLSLPLDLKINFRDANAWLFVFVSLGIASILLAVLLGVVSAFLGKSRIGRLLAFPTAWIIGQVLLCYIPLSFPLPLESSLAQVPLMIQIARVFSVYSIPFVIILTNVIIKEVFFPNGNFSFGANRITFTLLFALIVLHTLNVFWGIFSLEQRENCGKDLRVTFIQPCFLADAVEASDSQAMEIKSRVVYFSKMAIEKYPSTELMIWPETSVGYALQDDQFRQSLYKEINSKGIDLLMGGNYFNVFNRKDSMNIAFLIDKYGVNDGFYFKTKLFPFVEAGYKSTMVELRNQTILQTSNGAKIGMLICLESLYPYYARRRVQEGANVLGILSTDTSFGNSAISYLHMYLSALRAVENDKYVFHVGNSGPSAIFDPKGRKIAEIPFGKVGFQCATIKFEL